MGQGGPISLKDYQGKVVVVEVFQVNCPGCFIYGIPEAIDTFQKYKNNDVVVLGLATAFEDFDKNTLENLKLLLKENKVIGETLTTLTYQSKLLNEGRLSYSIPFPVGMDMLVKKNFLLKKRELWNLSMQTFLILICITKRIKSKLFHGLNHI